MTASRIDFDALRAQLDGFALVPQWLPGGKARGSEWISRNPTRGDRAAGSFSCNMQTGLWADFATGDTGGDLVSLWAYLHHGGDNVAAARDLMERHHLQDAPAPTENVRPIDSGRPVPVMPVPDSAPEPSLRHPRHGEPTAVYTYRDTTGRPLMHVCRYDPPEGRKQILPRTWCRMPDGSESWQWRGITGHAPRPLYGLDLLAARPDDRVLIVEGEKTADAANRMLAGLGVVAVSWLGGTSTANRAKLTPLRGRHVVMWPDHDAQIGDDDVVMPVHEQPGPAAMIQIATALAGVAASVVVVPYTPDEELHGWDLADAELDGWDGERVVSGLDRAVDVQSFAAGSAPEPSSLDISQRMNVWTFPVLTGKDGSTPANVIANVEHLCAAYGIEVRYNEMTKAREIAIPGESYLQDNADANALATMTSLAALNSLPQSRIAEYLDVIADKRAYHPVAAWIESRPWDGVSRMRQMCDTLRTTGDPELRDVLLTRWMISCVAAIYEKHGVEAHGALVLQGPQYIGKSRWVRSLGPRGTIATGKTVDPANKDHILEAVAHWICELGELDATFRKADIARLKAFITKDLDEVRRPYARAASRLPRRTIFFGSVNPTRYLVDDTGNRRWWTIPVTHVDSEHAIDMQQMWAEVREWYRQGQQWWLTQSEAAALNAANAEFESVDPLDELIAERWDWDSSARVEQMTATEVLKAIGYDRPQRRDATAVSEILRRMTGGEPRKTNGRRVFSLPPRRRIIQDH